MVRPEGWESSSRESSPVLGLAFAFVRDKNRGGKGDAEVTADVDPDLPVAGLLDQEGRHLSCNCCWKGVGSVECSHKYGAFLA